MNSVPNSDSEKCTDSKLSRVHSAPTLGLGCADTMHALRRVAGLARSCRTLCRSQCRHTPRARCCAPCPSLPGIVGSTAGRVPGRIAACLAIQPSGQAALRSQYAHSYRDTIPQQPGPCASAARLTSKPAISWHVLAVSWLCLAVSWLLLPVHARPLSRYSAVYRDQVQNGQ